MASGSSWDWTPTSCRPCWTWKACSAKPGDCRSQRPGLSRDTGLGVGPFHGPTGVQGQYPHWQELAGRVREVLRGVWRASSLVECINSVARMHQGRHRKMTQGLLDLKRLYWNLHQFRAGHRKNQTPYGLWAGILPALSFWEFLRMTPEELQTTPSASR